MKGLAILLVVFGHIGIGYYNAGVYPEHRDVFYVIYNIIYAFHMPLFMTLSGYVYYKAYFNEAGMPDRSRVYQQVGNLVAVYFIFGIPMGLVKVLAGSYANEATSLTDIALIAVKPLAPYWYLYVLIIFYLVFSGPQMIKISRTAKAVLAVTAAICGSVISISWLSLSNALYYSLFFYLGVCHRKYGKTVIGNVKLTVLSFCASVLLMTFLWNGERVVSSYPVVSIVAALGIVLAVWYLFENVPSLQKNRFLRACGRYSLEIYVIHHTLAAGFRALFPRAGISSAFMSAALNFVLSTSIPVLFSLGCKRLGIHGLLFRPVSYLRGRKTEKY